MKFNVAKSATVIFPPYKGSKRVTYMFPSFTLDGCPILVVDNCKYLGHFLSSKDDDDVDILHQNRLLYARTNLHIRKFGRCSKEVKLCLFKAYCMNFYGESLWECYSTTVLKRFEASYVKCIKMFFGYDKYHSVTMMLLDLGLPTMTTILHNAKVRLRICVTDHVNKLVAYVHAGGSCHGYQKIAEWLCSGS